ncbi:MAG: 4Fe-4S cluster-binding domain-containing protein, partial [Betaproteobacteria bacterium]
MISIALNKAHFPVTVLGPGRRIGLWTQGCSIGCKGCISQDTWDQDESRRVPVDTLVAWCRSACNDQLDGITISGGEPFDQPEALRALLEALWAWRAELSEPFDILCYSGHPLRRLERQHGDICLLYTSPSPRDTQQLSLIHISEPTRHTTISYGVVC